MSTSNLRADFPWPDTDRAATPELVESWAGEVRVNLVRMAGLIAFYANHLVNVLSSPGDADLAGIYHLQVTALVMVWSAGVVAIYFSLLRRWAVSGLKYFVTVWDLALVTSLVMLSGGPRSPLAVLYFLVIAAAPLRISLGLVYVATIGSMLAYLFLVGHYAYYLVGHERYYAQAELRIPRAQQIIVLLGLAVAGVLAGQVVRQVLRLTRAGTEAGSPTSASLAAADARRDSTLIGVGVLMIAALLAVGLCFAFTASPDRVGAGAPLWALVGVSVAFLVAVAAGVMELFQSRRASSTPRENKP